MAFFLVDCSNCTKHNVFCNVFNGKVPRVIFYRYLKQLSGTLKNRKFVSHLQIVLRYIYVCVCVYLTVPQYVDATFPPSYEYCYDYLQLQGLWKFRGFVWLQCKAIRWCILTGRDATKKDSGTTNLLICICSDIYDMRPTLFLERQIILRLVPHVLTFPRVPLFIILVIGRGWTARR